MAKDVLGAPAGGDLLRTLAGARGNPFLIGDLLAGLREENLVRVVDGRAGMAGNRVPRRLEDSAISPDDRADNARKGLSLPGLAANTRARLQASLFHNLLVAHRLDEGLAIESQVRKSVLASSDIAAQYFFQIGCSAMEYQLGHFDAGLRLLADVDSGQLAAFDDPRERLMRSYRSWLLSALDRLDEALEVYRRIREIDPDNAQADWNTSFIQLLRGEFREGWQRREARWRMPELPATAKYPDFGKPMWRGERDIAGTRTLRGEEQEC